MSRWSEEEVLSSRHVETDSDTETTGFDAETETALPGIVVTVWDQNVWVDCEFTLDRWINGIAKPGELCTWEDGPCSRVAFGTVFCENGHVQTSCSAGPDAVDNVVDDGVCNWLSAQQGNTASSESVVGTGDSVEKTPEFKFLTTSENEICGILKSGKAQCWGDVLVPPADILFSKLSLSTLTTDVVDDRHYACGLQENGQMYCFGAPFLDNPRPFGEELFDDVVAKSAFVCGLREEGDNICMVFEGTEGFLPPDDESYEQFLVRPGNSCGLRDDGSVVCWGDSIYLQEDPLPGLTIVQLVDVPDFVCALTSGGEALCWGNDSPAPESPPLEQQFIQLAAGGSHVCGLREDGTFSCWGDHFFEQCDLENVINRYAGVEFVQLAAGTYHDCGLSSDGRVFCWGITVTDEAAPSGKVYSQIDVGDIPCALRENGAVECFGMGSWCNGRESGWEPMTPAAGMQFSQIDVAAIHACGVEKASRRIVCWGGPFAAPGNSSGFCSEAIQTYSAYYQFGEEIPLTAPNNGGFKSVFAAALCGLRMDGRVQCWYDDGILSASIPSGTPFVQASMSEVVSCGVTLKGEVLCWPTVTWAYNSGWLNSGTFTCDAGMPELGEDFVSIPDGVYTQVMTAGIHDECCSKQCTSLRDDADYVCGLLVDGTVECWGDARFSPDLATRCVSLDAGEAGGCCLLETGDVRCWNWPEDDVSPEVFAPPENIQFESISVGKGMCGIRADNHQEACWHGIVRNIWQTTEHGDL